MTRSFIIQMVDVGEGKIIIKANGNLSIPEIVSSIEKLKIEILTKSLLQGAAAPGVLPTTTIPTLEPRRMP